MLGTWVAEERIALPGVKTMPIILSGVVLVIAGQRRQILLLTKTPIPDNLTYQYNLIIRK
jgi:hypothetical protein